VLDIYLNLIITEKIKRLSQTVKAKQGVGFTATYLKENKLEAEDRYHPNPD
jgi:hypothetical protein